jgi:hypothetical protein
MKAIVAVKSGPLRGLADGIPDILVRAGTNAVFAAEEFFKATLNNAHTQRAYGRSVARFLACARSLRAWPVSMWARSRAPRRPKTRRSRRCATSSTAW